VTVRRNLFAPFVQSANVNIFDYHNPSDAVHRVVVTDGDGVSTLHVC